MMEALRVKYEQNRGEVLSRLDVSKELLEVLTRHGLIDIADCVKYQGISDSKKRNSSLMKTMVERRTERAYPLFIQSLRQVGQDSVADLLTDIGEETRLLTHLQAELENEIGAIQQYIGQEERRTGVTSSGPQNGGKCEHEAPAVSAAPTSDREVWVSVQSTLKRATSQFERCRAVIDKLHKDCQDLAAANGDMVVQIRNCYSRVKRMLRPNQPASTAAGVDVPKSTQAMFQSLIDDVEILMSRKSKALQEETEGRTSAMRLLRHLRDWIQERSSILSTLHASTGSSSPRVNRLPLLTSRRATSISNGGPHTPPQRLSSIGHNTPSPPRSRSRNPSEDGVRPVSPLHDRQEPELPVPVEPHAISSVLEGLSLLEQQIREYVHMEILLTDKYRSELRYKHLRKKGYTPRGLEEARRSLDRLDCSIPTFTNSTPNNTLVSRDPAGGALVDKTQVARLRSALDAICDEYNACVQYMNRVSASLARLADLDAFLAQTDESQSKKKRTDKDREKKARHRDSEDKTTSVFAFFRKKDTKPTSKYPEIKLPVILAPPGKKNLEVPGKNKLDASGRTNQLSRESKSAGVQGDSQKDSLLDQLKLLVGNFEMVKLRLTTVEDRYRHNYEVKRRAFEARLQQKEEEVARLELRLKEVEAEKEKYRSLYEHTKIGIANVKKR